MNQEPTGQETAPAGGLPDTTVTRTFEPAATTAPEGAAAAPGPAGGAGRFVVLRPHAAGGLGTVSVAFDTELNREVALKEIRPELADEAGCRARFLLEG